MKYIQNSSAEIFINLSVRLSVRVSIKTTKGNKVLYDSIRFNPKILNNKRNQQQQQQKSGSAIKIAILFSIHSLNINLRGYFLGCGEKNLPQKLNRTVDDVEKGEIENVFHFFLNSNWIWLKGELVGI